MTNSIPILNDDAVAELEAIMASGDSQAMYEAANIDNVRSLCATVRVLRAKHEWLRSKIAWHRDGVGPDVPILQERYDKLIAQRNDLQSQLDQVTKERDAARAENERLTERLTQEVADRGQRKH